MGEDRAVVHAVGKKARSEACDAEVAAVLKKYACTAVVEDTEVKMNGAVVTKNLRILFVPVEDMRGTPL